MSDALYAAHHPRLLVTSAGLPELAAKLSDGGIDDAIYVRVRDVVQNVYPGMSVPSIMGPWYGDQAIPCVGLVGLLEQDDDALALGKMLTLHVANAYEPDNDEAYSGMRLRALVLGYDLCFQNATEVERGIVRDEIVRYIQRMIWYPAYQVFEQRPYLGNHSAMFAAPLGMAGIALQGETEDYLLVDAMAMADRIVDNLLRYEFDPKGAYNEGVFYAAWTLKQLVYYFDARHRFDGRSYADNPQFSLIEEWLAYELSPAGGGRSHNLNDSPMIAPLAQHPTFFNWAMDARNSALSAWLWEHTAGGWGAGYGAETDWSGTLLWYKPITPASPAAILPPGRVWTQRGLYYYRNGWPAGSYSNDVVFSFYSGKFQGGHAQEDQNQFALTAYGTAFAIDHGAGSLAKQSEAHNLVFIDGQGQHNAGSAIGTDGAITHHLLGDFADWIVGDATAAYGTYSEFNQPNVPLSGSDWSWGYSGANPVLSAVRRVLLIRGPQALPYAVMMEDINKDGGTHSYEWRLHTPNTNTVNAIANPVVISGATAVMNLHVIYPPFADVSITTSPFDAGNTDPASTLVKIARTAVNPKFTFVMIPRLAGTPAPLVSRREFSWGCGATVDWGNGTQDIIVRNDSGVLHTYANVRTDGVVAAVRKTGSAVTGYVMATGSTLIVSNVTHVTVSDAPASCEVSGATAWLDRADADFAVLDTGINRVLHDGTDVGFVRSGNYIVPDGITAVVPTVAPALSVSAQPNPFNPSTMIRIDGVRGERVRVTIYDVAGRRVRGLWSGVVEAERSITWDGRNDGGIEVSSGTYFARVTTPSRSHSLKLTLVK